MAAMRGDDSAGSLFGMLPYESPDRMRLGRMQAHFRLVYKTQWSALQ